MQAAKRKAAHTKRAILAALFLIIAGIIPAIASASTESLSKNRVMGSRVFFETRAGVSDELSQNLCRGCRGCSYDYVVGSPHAPKGGVKKSPNPDGKLGGPPHRVKVAEVVEDIESRGLIPETEVPLKTVEGVKNVRFMDVVGRDPLTGEIVEVHQVGKTLKTKPKIPISRERTSYRDVRHNPQIRKAKKKFHQY